LSKVLDTYLQCEENGQLEGKLKAIKEMVEKRISKKVIAQTLGISERTLINHRKNTKIRLRSYYKATKP
jgi:FixJ family two-component response regulator